MRATLRTIQDAYRYPVDVEFTINLSQNGDYVINILQCRPLKVFQDSRETTMAENVDPDAVIFEYRHSDIVIS